MRLQTIFRQEAGSYIIANAHRINHGEMPIIDNDGARDFFLFKTEEPERAAQLCVELVTERIPRRFGIAPEDIQVLSPMHRGVIGVGALNEQLQAALNPPAANKPERKIGSRAYRSGDRVMQIRNNYEKDVYNGDMGRITGIDLEMHQVSAVFDGRTVVYDFLGAGRARARLCRQRAQEPGQRVPRRGHPRAHVALHDAAAQPALHRASRAPASWPCWSASPRPSRSPCATAR